MNIDVLKHYRVKHQIALVLLAKPRDGRKFKNITIAKILRQFFIQIAIDLCVAQILTGFICKSAYRKQCILARKVTDICGGKEVYSFKGKYSTCHVFHAGSNTRVAKDVCKQTSEIVSKTLSTYPYSKS